MANPFQSVAYLQVRRRWLGVQVMTWAGRTGSWAGVPESLLLPDAKGRLQAYATDDPRLMNAVHARPYTAFTHSRVVFDNFDETQLTLKVFLRKAGWRASSGYWTFVFQLRDDWLCEVTDIERRALVQLGKQIGANRVLIVSAARELTVPEVLQISRGPHPARSGAPLIALDLP